MIHKLQLLQAVHNAFFQHDKGNLVAMGTGFALSATSILLVFLLY